VLIITGVALTTAFREMAMRQFETGIFDVVEGLFAGTTVVNGVVTPPSTTDPRSTRAFSGRYWQIAEPTPQGIRAVTRSRSLFDQVLPGPPGGVEALATPLGEPIYYDVMGPQHTHLRAVALMALVPNRTEPLIFMGAQDRRPVDKSAWRFAVLT